MPKIRYVQKRFSPSSQKVIALANKIIAEYFDQGFALTLRQLYYQFISRNAFPESWFDEELKTFNTQKNYKKLGSKLNDARLAGLVDWKSIEDRTRNLQSLAHWDGPSDIVKACAEQFRVNLWEDQAFRPEVWIEKDALIGVIEKVCNELDVPFFSCRGYTSQSEAWQGSQRFHEHAANGQTPIIFHFGDHDPSGIDMTRDIQNRMEIFGLLMETKRIALNMDQVEKYEPPPNPAKTTDSRCKGYILEYGHDSWELDALEPKVLVSLIRKEIKKLIDKELWEKSVEKQMQGREKLQEVADSI